VNSLHSRNCQLQSASARRSAASVVVRPLAVVLGGHFHCAGGKLLGITKQTVNDQSLSIIDRLAVNSLPELCLVKHCCQNLIRTVNGTAQAIQEPCKPARDVEAASLGKFERAMIYPNPLDPAKYVVLNTGLTIEDRGYNGDYGTPLWGDFAIVKVKPGAFVPDVLTAGLFDENWQLPK
jgi:hypothetical protein